MALLGMGNPLLDISAEVGQDVLDKYGLKGGDAILAEDKHQPLFGEMVKMPNVQYIAGGATQNTIRVAQWMLQQPGATAYMGCVGKDANGETLAKACQTDGVAAHYMVDEKTPTGTCATLIVGIERSLCTNLSAANNYKVDHVKKPEMWKIVEAAKIVYSAGFFITVSPESIEAVSNHTAASGAIYCLNLSAPFISQVPPFRACLQKTLPNCDYLFGNETESRAYSEAVGWESDNVEFIATRMSLIPMNLKGGESRKRKVVITQGMDPTIVAVNGHVTRHPTRIGNQGPIIVPEEKVIDTNGAGDAFVGGFLAALSKGKDVAECCKAGNHAAAIIIQHSGCTYPASPNYTF